MSAEFEYYGLMAETWDLFRGDTSQWSDRFFYLDMVKKHGEPILDVGCGTGRLLLDFMKQGIDIDGVDNSPDMLNLCRGNARDLNLDPLLFEQEMEVLDLPRQYQTILVPSSSFQLLLDMPQAKNALSRFSAHLKPGGVLIMPFMVIWKPGDPLETDWTLTGEKVRSEDQTVVQRWSRDWYTPDEQLEHTENRYDVLKDGAVIFSEKHRRSPATRWYMQEQALDLYRDVGFVNLEIYSGFSQVLAKSSDTLFTIVGYKPLPPVSG